MGLAVGYSATDDLKRVVEVGLSGDEFHDAASVRAVIMAL
jgi:hypothetical protein